MTELLFYDPPGTPAYLPKMLAVPPCRWTAAAAPGSAPTHLLEEPMSGANGPAHVADGRDADSAPAAAARATGGFPGGAGVGRRVANSGAGKASRGN